MQQTLETSSTGQGEYQDQLGKKRKETVPLPMVLQPLLALTQSL